MKYTVLLLPHAERDVDTILAWLHERSPQGAAAWYRRWLEIMSVLEDSAGGCGLAPEDKDHEATIQQITFKTRSGGQYRALLAIRESCVYVLHVRGPGQNLLARGELRFPPEE